MISEVEGKSLPDVVDEQVLIPLGMTQTGFVLKDGLPVAVLMQIINRTYQNGGWTRSSFCTNSIIFDPSRIFDKTTFPSGGGSISGTADDYVKLLEIRLVLFSLKKLEFRKINFKSNLTSNTYIYWLGLVFLGFSVLKNPILAKTPQAKGTYQLGGIWGHACGLIDKIN